LDSGDHLAEEEKNQWVHFIMRFQQLTGPLMAKGFEDTTLYIYSRLLSLNEVGGNPGRFGISLEEFHEFNKTRARLWPHTLNATSTHDTKRGEDVRSRINVLSEIPEEWERNIRKWSRINKKHKALLKSKVVPDSNDEYFLYQSLLGAFPFEEEQDPSFLERVKNYMIKAVREAKVHTEWVKPDIAYEETFIAFIDKVLEPRESNPFLQEFLPFLKKFAPYGMLNSLSQTLLKILSPGLPDFYQGTELWDLTFVDPDNRRPVDFKRRMELLAELQHQEAKERAPLVSDLLAHWHDGRIKLYVTYKALHFRSDRKELFEKGEYVPLYAAGKAKEHVCAFARRKGDTWALVVVPRFVTERTSPGKLPLGGEVWGTSAVPLPRGVPNNWINVLTGEPVALSGTGKKKLLRLRRTFRSFPLALLAPAERPSSK
jgi:(1->4)-alpha-D-glucan 1-alpha-D-glucosylmutase